ncbi:phosphodiesterase [Thioclava sp. DLFJ5-1]|uniref:glycerophosphodiester phosphodiesterase family protein n=1 Tax=Thioclava sp. DLFJ5-1 TaxID=1915314 RepID=UPI00099893D6|nr:glycerophosphodiester phosphodiesterase family protein [Thioclava sp. DLFJ5-1]OOY20286.1 phosphodiesterase [Thioclava sp. DLFJ5-1]
MMALHPDFLRLPIAHRALHDYTLGRPENSRGAIRAAIAAGYGIEIDVQLSADGVPMVFHDYALDRLTAERGPVRQRTSAELGAIHLSGTQEGIPTLAEVLKIVDGQVPLLVEIKDQDGALGQQIGPLEEATALLLRDYEGPVAVMSFNPHAVAAFGELAPGVPVGLTTSAYQPNDWALLPAARGDELRHIPDFERVGAAFISHEAKDLNALRVSELKSLGVPVLCWTIRSVDEEALARRVADNVTFEGYLSALPA